MNFQDKISYSFELPLNKEMSIPTEGVSEYIGSSDDHQRMSEGSLGHHGLSSGNIRGWFRPSGVTIRECQSVLRADIGFSEYFRVKSG